MLTSVAYSYSGSASSQKTCLLWAGEDGQWHRSEPATTDVWSSEAAAVVLEDGTVRVFYRSGSSILCYTDYLWVDGEYVRDENNTSVSTEAAKNAGNGCMLTAVMYPEKVTGREMILVATPSTSNSRSNGYIYAFCVNADGSMELVASYDITPGASEYYAYSCMSVLTQGSKAGDLALFWENAAAGIRYDVIDIDDVLVDLKEVVQKDVALTVGESATFTDDEDYYVGADTSALDTNVATVQISGTILESQRKGDQAVTAIESGVQYILVNTRAGKTMTNVTTTSAAAAGAGNGLSLSGTQENVTDAAIWTIEAVNGGYRVTDANGNHLTVSSNGAGVTAEESIVTIAPNGSSWTISQNGAYLNDFGGGGTCAAGWQHASAATDSGSQWSIYTIREVPVEGTSEITFTGVGVGQTQVQIGYVLYNITVTEAPQVNPFVDVPMDSFFYDAVLWAVENGITNGVDDTHFGPTASCSRAQVVTFLWRAAGSPEPASTNNPFEDVKADAYYHKAVLWAVEKGITNGVDATHFGPNVSCNRAQVVTFLWRANGQPASSAEVRFSDVQAGQFYTTAVAWAVEKGITNGMDESTFGIGEICNRAQVVTFLYRADK